MGIRHKSFLLGLGLLSVLSLACGTQTQLDTSWAVRQPADAPFNRLAVIAAMRSPGDSREFESAAVGALERQGVGAVPGFVLLEERTDLSREEMERRVRESGADGVLVFKMLGIDTTDTYTPPTQYYVTDPPHSGWFDDAFWGYYTPYPYDYWGYWYPAVQVAYTPGYWTTTANYRVETSLYSAATGKLVWTATSSTYDPAGEYDVARSLTDEVAVSLKRRAFLAAKAP